MTEPLYVGGAAGYDELFARVTQSFMPALLGAAQIAVGHRVLDVATGTGAAAKAAAGLVGPSGEVVAGDVSRTMLDVARRNLKDTPIDLEVFDGQCAAVSGGSFRSGDLPNGPGVLRGPRSRTCRVQSRAGAEWAHGRQRQLDTRTIAFHPHRHGDRPIRACQGRAPRSLRFDPHRRTPRCAAPQMQDFPISRSTPKVGRSRLPRSTTTSAARRLAPASRDRNTSSCPRTFNAPFARMSACRFPTTEAASPSRSRWRCLSAPGGSDRQLLRQRKRG